MKRQIPLLFLLMIWIVGHSQPALTSRISLPLKPGIFQTLGSAGVAVEESVVSDNSVLLELGTDELEKLNSLGIDYTVLIRDVSKYYADRYRRELADAGVKARIKGEGMSYSMPSHFYLGSMGGFYTWNQILNQLDSMALLFPGVVQGKQAISNVYTAEGRPVYYVKISDNPGINEPEPEVLYTSLHHAREGTGMQQLLYFMWYLLENYSKDTLIHNIINHTELYFVPVVNPDGYHYNELTNPSGGGMWRKNRRNNGNGSFGVDINRNYGYMWGYDNIGSSPDPESQSYRGTSAFSESETQNIRDFCIAHNFRIALNFHSGTFIFLYPWGYIAQPPPAPDDNIYNFFAQLMNDQSLLVYGSGGANLYTTNGEAGDWMYGEQSAKPKIFANTPELSPFWPALADIIPLCHRYLDMNLKAALLSSRYAEVRSKNPPYLSKIQGYLRYEIQRLGLDSPATYTVSVVPLDNNLSMIGAPNSYSNLALMQTTADSIYYQLNTTVQNGQQLTYILKLSNGDYSFYDTVSIPLYSEVRGRVSYLNNTPTMLQNAKVILENGAGIIVDSTLTKNDAEFKFRNLPDGIYQVKASPWHPLGGVNSVDALQTMRHFTGFITLTGLPLIAADVNLTGFINSVDALIILKRFVGLISSFTCGDWISEVKTFSVDSLSSTVRDIRVLCAGDVNCTYIPEPCHPPVTPADAGSDQLVINGTSTMMSPDSPSWGETGTWMIIRGTGGSLSDIHNPNAVLTGQLNEDYLLLWVLHNTCSSDSDEVVISFSNPPCPGLSQVNYGGKDYRTVQIGNQCWLRKNLDVGIMIPGNVVQSDNNIIEKYCYNNEPANCEEYGGLYQWDELMEYRESPYVKGICPEGWHVATDADWCELTTFLDSTGSCSWGASGTYAGGLMKQIGYQHWITPNQGATNTSGFSAVGSGGREYNSSNFSGLKYEGMFWSSNNEYTTHAIFWRLNTFGEVIERYNNWQEAAYAARCVKDTCSLLGNANAGPDQLNLTSTYTLLEATPPAQYETGIWSISSGQGGYIADPSDPASAFYGEAGTSYLLAWTLVNQCGVSDTDTVQISFASSGSQACGSVTVLNYGGQVYHVVGIGDQCWLKENLNIGTMIPGNQAQADNDIIEKYCYDNNPANCAEYGGLYQWKEMMRYHTPPLTQGICPSGWHVATDAEWCTLVSFLDSTAVCDWGTTGEYAGGMLKETGYQHWAPPNAGASNLSGFSAVGSGSRDYNNSTFSGLTYDCPVWTSTMEYTTHGIYWRLNTYGEIIQRYNYWQEAAYAIRCIKDTCNPLSTADAGPDQLNLENTWTNLEATPPDTGETGSWAVIGGLGGYIFYPSDPSSLFGGYPGFSYQLVWTINNACGNYDSDTVIISFAGEPPQPCGGITSVSYGGQTYHTIEIGTWCWMKENMNIGTMIPGNQSQTNNGIIEKYCYDNNPDHCSEFGALYQWDELMQYQTAPGVQGICPAGWHIPADWEWCAMTAFLDPGVSCACGLSGSYAGGQMKETGTIHWSPANVGATNLSNFTGLGAGKRQVDGNFADLLGLGIFWTSTWDNEPFGFMWMLDWCQAGIHRYSAGQEEGFSVRCIRDY